MNALLADVAARYGATVAPDARVHVLPRGASAERLLWDGKRLAHVDALGQPLDKRAVRAKFNPHRPRRGGSPSRGAHPQVDAVRDQVADLVTQGLTDGQVAARLDLPHARVVVYRIARELPANITRGFGPALVAQLGAVKDMLARGFSPASIETKLGWRKGVVAKLLALDAPVQKPGYHCAAIVARRAQVAQLAAQGQDVAQICAALGQPAHRIRRDLRLAQIGGARAGSSARSARHARLLELVNQGQSVAQIAAALGVGETCVFRDLQKLRGVVPDVPLGANARRVQASQQRRAKVADLAARGHDTGAIAAALGVTPRRVVRDLYEARHED